ncbi:hypothetical protein ACF0H5_009616 [Mactra antiquata]
MKQFSICFITLAMVLGAWSHGVHINDTDWKGFKVKFNKTYTTKEEEILRYSSFRQNAQRINNHNSEADKGLHTYWVEINEYADMTHEEYNRKMNGLRHDENLEDREMFLNSRSSLNLTALPYEIDWRKSGCITGVKTQGHCGSCYAFATTGSLEYKHCKQTGKLVSLSEQNIIDCTDNLLYLDKGCFGGQMDHAFKYIIFNKGIDTEQSYPYHAKLGNCKYSRAGRGATMISYRDIRFGDEEELKEAVGTLGPVAVGIDAKSIEFLFYHYGIYDNSWCSSTKVNHGALIVGYGTEYGQDYWLLKNSWGPNWGMNGYVKMVRNQGNRCGIASLASYPIV